MREGLTSEQANSFGRAADEYERSRPTYPAAAVEWLVPAGTRTVVDVGAGTGKFTRSLSALGLEVTAVEPSEGMRERLRTELPDVPALAGTAEELPLPDASVDLVTLAQTWHWVDEEQALAEAARVLRPGGSLGLVWNLRDERTGWVRRLTEAIGRSGAEALIDAGLEIGAPFGATAKAEFAWSRPLDPELLLELVRSRSYVIVAPVLERERILGGVRDLLADDPELAGREAFQMPYLTHCFRARRR